MVAQVQFYTGKVLFSGTSGSPGSVAMDPACCCAAIECPVCSTGYQPQYLKVTLPTLSPEALPHSGGTYDCDYCADLAGDYIVEYDSICHWHYAISPKICSAGQLNVRIYSSGGTYYMDVWIAGVWLLARWRVTSAAIWDCFNLGTLTLSLESENETPAAGDDDWGCTGSGTSVTVVNYP